MKKISIYYFSGTGNTHWIARRLEVSLMDCGSEVFKYSIEGIRKEDLDQQVQTSNHIIIGFPVYGSYAPKPMIDFISKLPDVKNKKVSVYATHALASGDTAIHVAKLLEKKGYSIRQTKHFTMMNNFHLPDFRFLKPRNDKRLAKRLYKTLPKVDAFSQEIVKDKLSIRGNNSIGHFLGNLQRKHIDQLVAKIGSQLSVEENRCTKCHLCIRVCPTKNIAMESESISFQSKCAACLRCYSKCPTSAILIGEGSLDTEKYPRFKGPNILW